MLKPLRRPAAASPWVRAALPLAVSLTWLLGAPPASAAPFDAAAAEAQLKANNCTKCHTVDRKKDGPAYRDVAAKFRPDPDAEKKIIHHMTSGEMVKLPDGHEERHKKLKTTDEAEWANLARWILSLPGGTKY